MSNLTKSQQELADLLLNTKIEAKVRRRKQNSDGSFKFYYVIRETSPVDFRADSTEFAFVHHEKNPTAPLSPIIVNLRNLPQNLVTKIASALAEVKLRERPDFCTGIPNAAIPFAKEFSRISKIPYVTIFEKDDNPGKPRILPAKETPFGNGKTLLIIDDVITKGESKFRAFEVAEKLGYKVVGLLILVDRDEGGRETLEKAGYEFYAPFKLAELLKYYSDKNSIDKKRYNEVIEYLKFSKSL
ncbi:MAG: orotate phosphoribosyltransferase [Microgenomates group bacterium Gr01-1014_7]|nr:MAG: orotate phosphoribosyltransferase [Microgenomates group bacterium Gr01-1014_7]